MSDSADPVVDETVSGLLTLFRHPVIAEALDRIAEQTGRSRSEVAGEITRAGLELANRLHGPAALAEGADEDRP